MPAGILDHHWPNTLAIAVWSLDSTTGGLETVSLVAAGKQASAVQVPPVSSPGYDPAVYGPPVGPGPTLAAVPFSALALRHVLGEGNTAKPDAAAADRRLGVAVVAVRLDGIVPVPDCGELFAAARKPTSIRASIRAASSAVRP